MAQKPNDYSSSLWTLVTWQVSLQAMHQLFLIFAIHSAPQAMPVGAELLAVHRLSFARTICLPQTGSDQKFKGASGPQAAIIFGQPGSSNLSKRFGYGDVTRYSHERCAAKQKMTAIGGSCSPTIRLWASKNWPFLASLLGPVVTQAGLPMSQVSWWPSVDCATNQWAWHTPHPQRSKRSHLIPSPASSPQDCFLGTLEPLKFCWNHLVYGSANGIHGKLQCCSHNSPLKTMSFLGSRTTWSVPAAAGWSAADPRVHNAWTRGAKCRPDPAPETSRDLAKGELAELHSNGWSQWSMMAGW